MISFLPEKTDSVLRADHLSPKLFMFAGKHPDTCMKLMDGSREIGKAELYYDGKHNAYVDAAFHENADDEQIRHGFSAAFNEAIRRFHPAVIYSASKDPRFRRIYPGMLFFPQGQVYKRVIEPWRYQIRDNCFDREGFVINQGGMDALPFGLFSTREKGCGWIAAYNLLKLCGREQTMEETASGLARFDITGEMFGENIFKLFLYLRSRKIPVKFALGRKAGEKALRNSRYGIVLYSRGKGSHYVSYRMIDSGNEIYIFNAVYGKAGHQMSVGDFFREYANRLKVLVLYVSQGTELL